MSHQYHPRTRYPMSKRSMSCQARFGNQARQQGRLPSRLLRAMTLPFSTKTSSGVSMSACVGTQQPRGGGCRIAPSSILGWLSGWGEGGGSGGSTCPWLNTLESNVRTYVPALEDAAVRVGIHCREFCKCAWQCSLVGVTFVQGLIHCRIHCRIRG